jgi:hypothetical protein
MRVQVCKKTWEVGTVGKTSSAAKNKWIAKRYSQIKIAIDPELAESFKSLCRAENTTVTGELSGFMSGRCRNEAPPKRAEKEPLSTRGGRRKLTGELIAMLEDIKDAEAAYLSNIPTNLQNSVNYENAEQCINALEEALDALYGAFG